MADPVVATYSIVACDLEAGQWGVATQSKYLAVGSVVPWAEPLVGAVATQAWANPRYGPDGLALLRDGLAADEVVARLTEADPGRAHRQLGVVDAAGRAASYTGERCMTGPADAPATATPRRGTSSSPARPSTRSRRRSRRPPERPLAEPPARRLDAAQAAGGDSRGQQSAATPGRREEQRLRRPLRHARRPPCRRPRGPLERAPPPVRHPRRALRQDAARRRGSTVDDELAAELRERLAALGYDGRPGRDVPALGREGEPGGAGRRGRAGRPGRAAKH